MTQIDWAGLACTAWAIEGSAMLAIDISSTDIEMPSPIANIAQYRRGSGSPSSCRVIGLQLKDHCRAASPRTSDTLARGRRRTGSRRRAPCENVSVAADAGAPGADFYFAFLRKCRNFEFLS